MNIFICGLLPVSVLVVMYASWQKVPIQKSIYGFWKGTFHNKELSFEFKSNRTCVLSFEDKNSGLVEVLIGNFEVGFSKEPTSLSVRNIPQIDHPLHTIVEFIGSDSIRLAQFSPRWRLRPLAFNRSNSMNLKRVEE